MSTALEVILEKDTTNDPSKLVQMIVKIADDINSCKNDLSELKERGLWERLFSNNTRDVANVMLKQNDTISLFMGIVQSVIKLHMHNVLMLSQIHEKLCVEMWERGQDNNRYTKMARDFIAQSYSTALLFKNKIDDSVETINDIKKQLILKQEIHEEQTRLINLINQKLAEKDSLDEEQSKLIDGLNTQVAMHRDALSDLESSVITIEGVNADFSARFEELAGAVAGIKTAYEAKFRNAHLAAAASLVVAVSALVVTFLM